MGEDLLDAKSKIACPGGTSDDRESSRNFSGRIVQRITTASKPANLSGLVGWRWGDLVSSWSLAERQLLNSSWRQSTLNTYYPAIKKCLNWSEQNKVSPQTPQVHQVARFLAYLHLEEKLAYSTILVHRFAISTFCGPSSSEVLSQNLLVRQVLKAIAAARPKDTRPPVWDVQIVVDWLAISRIKNTLCEISRRTAMILLLASGRRVHDLTLLRISEDRMSSSEERIILWPVFGSKTDSIAHRQSGWSLSKHPNEKVCPVAWIRKLIQVSQERRKQGKELHHLFITVTGEARPASKIVIGGLIRSVLKDARVEASPGSCRSAVASARSYNTFKRFYCREVRKSQEERRTESLFSNFQPEVGRSGQAVV